MVCYLFLFGAYCCFFLAWPARIGQLFRPVFSNGWRSSESCAVALLVVCDLLVMATRLNWLAQSWPADQRTMGKPGVCRLHVMLAYVPFHSFEFNPGALVDDLLAKTNGGKGD